LQLRPFPCRSALASSARRSAPASRAKSESDMVNAERAEKCNNLADNYIAFMK
jgi:hypothetical protein